ncbi:MAG: lytic transglycosylase domain-containing protein [Clostridia bacterium]|nr:lytic transglycosylase domain-containing protein [Clostridia bacterium]
MKKYIAVIVVILIVVFMVITPPIFINVSYQVKYNDIILKYAKIYNLDSNVVLAVIKTESNFNASAKSKVGAMGLMQIMPDTAKEIAFKLKEDYVYEMLYDVDTNIEYGCYYIRYLLNMFDEDYNLAIASFNAGFSNVKMWLKNVEYSMDGKNLTYIPFKETREYVKKVNFAKKIYKIKCG